MSETAATGQRIRGQCLCGAVQFEVDVPERQYSVCHCGMCRRWSGGPLMSVHCPEPNTEWRNDEGLTWYQGTPWAQRGFCARCGSSLFWRLAEQPEGMLIVSVDALEDADGFQARPAHLQRREAKQIRVRGRSAAGDGGGGVEGVWGRLARAH